MTSTAHTQVVQKQFGEQASAYLSSAVHAQGTEFALLQAELAGQGDARVLDLGCGAGHVSFHVAPLVKEVVAYDLSQQMLDVVAAAAADRGLANIPPSRRRRTPAVCRWRIRFRVQPLFGAPLERPGPGPARSAPGAETGWRGGVHRCVVAGQPAARHLPANVEVLRDTSHVRDYSAAEWLRQVSEAGLHVRSTRASACAWSTAWVERMRTPEMRVAIRQLQQSWARKCANITRLRPMARSAPMCWCCGPSAKIFPGAPEGAPLMT
jgi:SAM-dependent methyltransferase